MPVPQQFPVRDRTASVETLCCTSDVPQSTCWMGEITSMREEEDTVQDLLQVAADGFSSG